MANTAIARQDRPLTVAAALKQSIPALAMALPKHMDPERMARIALTTIRASACASARFAKSKPALVRNWTKRTTKDQRLFALNALRSSP